MFGLPERLFRSLRRRSYFFVTLGGPGSSLRTLLVLTLFCVCAGWGCGKDTSGSTLGPGEGPTIHTLPDGTPLAIPAGASFWYSHAEITGGTVASELAPTGPGTLVISRIDWSFCNPKAAKLEFTGVSGVLMPEYTWRIPTVVETPLAGISILGIFAGDNLEGGLTVELADFPAPGGVLAYRITSCTGDWVSVYGYYFN